jgi:hypothetical protein
VSGRALTIPDRIEATSAALFVDPPGAGRLAAFFAAAPGALAVERRLPLGSPDARPLSQFSYALTRAIASGRLRSLRDLATAIGASDAALGGDAPEPVFEGMLEMPVLGLPADRPRRYPLARDTMTLPAGVEEGLAAGDSVRLLAAGTVVGEAKVVEAGLGVSRLAAAPLLPTGSIEAERMLGAGGGGQTALLAAIAPLVARGAAADLEVSAQLWRPGAAPQCPTLPGGSPRGATSVPMLSPPPLGQCDVLIATIANRGIAAVDISPIYFDAGGRVSGLGFVGGGSARVRPGEARRVAIRALATGRDGAPSPLGVERMAIVALPAVTRTPRDLRGAASATFRSGTTAALDAGAGALVYRWRVVGR